MSEYQYYEFQVVDRRLSKEEMKQLRTYSTRAKITPTSFVNEYHWGGFKGDQNAWMEKYFDGFLYFANWGTRELQLALSAKVLTPEIAERYCCSEIASFREKSDRVILGFFQDGEERGEWLDGEGSLSSFLQLRNELAAGDLRLLYLGWLLGVQSDAFEETDSEPPLPPNLADLSGAQMSFVEFFDLDPHLLAAAAQNSPRTNVQPANEREFSSWVASLPVQEKDEWLVRAMTGEGVKVGMELQSGFHRARGMAKATAAGKRRTVAELLVAAEAHGQDGSFDR